MTERPVIRVMTVDDHPLARSGLRTFLSGFPDLELVAEASSGSEALDLYAYAQPDVVLMDMLMLGMDGVETTRTLRQRNPQARIIILTSTHEATMIEGALRAGATGYLLKHATALEIAQAIRNAHAGRSAMSRDAMDTLIHAMGNQENESEPLNEREYAILRLLAQGCSNSDIAAALCISRSTVKYHLSHIFAKLGVSSRAAAIALAYERRLLAREE